MAAMASCEEHFCQTRSSATSAVQPWGQENVTCSPVFFSCRASFLARFSSFVLTARFLCLSFLGSWVLSLLLRPADLCALPFILL